MYITIIRIHCQMQNLNREKHRLGSYLPNNVKKYIFSIIRQLLAKQNFDCNFFPNSKNVDWELTLFPYFAGPLLENRMN